MDNSPSSTERDRLDPLVLHARRETLVILAAFAVCMVWSIGCCYCLGYLGPDGGPAAKVLGMPSWVFWGVAVPWLAADVFAVWFCFFFMVDDPLDEALDETNPDGCGRSPDPPTPLGEALDETNPDGCGRSPDPPTPLGEALDETNPDGCGRSPDPPTPLGKAPDDYASGHDRTAEEDGRA